MPKWYEYLSPFGGGSKFTPGLNKKVQNFLFGTPEERENVSTLRPEQEALYQQAVNAGLQPGAGGAYGTAADYYRNLLSDESADYQAFTAPTLREYYEDISPNIAEQYAGMGAGGLTSSGFRNAQVQGATDLAERLGRIRANLRQSAAQGLQNIGQAGLQSYSQNMVTKPGSEGFLTQIAAPLAQAGLAYATGNPGFAIGGGNNVGAKTSPYGSSTRASPNIGTTGRYY